MKLLELTLPTPAENLALDEALLDAAEAGELPDEVLRLWEPSQPLVVVGRSIPAGRKATTVGYRQRWAVFRAFRDGQSGVLGL